MKHYVYPLILPLFNGPSLSMGNGTAKAWFITDIQGNPASIGFSLRKTAFDNLPVTLYTTDPTRTSIRINADGRQDVALIVFTKR
ncbi:hypothetical protein IC229_23085 [Spirosoma sp. BT702]|uniref:Uncharacterized protein n=1 Tax=Spirosoma profusum TaxID=2771354 RepID=A0A926Y2Z7_9BACT|nr:hypothetical protein [Spirosoma profusum]MBD2703547.1 hypothetical protein [Spirosoma profusum]